MTPSKYIFSPISTKNIHIQFKHTHTKRQDCSWRQHMKDSVKTQIKGLQASTKHQSQQRGVWNTLLERLSHWGGGGGGLYWKQRGILTCITLNRLVHLEPQVRSRKANSAHSHSTKQNVASFNEQEDLQTQEVSRSSGGAALWSKTKLQLSPSSLLPGRDDVFGRFSTSNPERVWLSLAISSDILQL